MDINPCLDVGKHCSRCCKLESVRPINKPANQWCKHSCGGGCAIYYQRPEPCIEYECLWLEAYNRGAKFPPGLKPSECGATMRASIEGKGIVVNLDDGIDWRKGALGNFVKITSEQFHIIIRHRYNLKVVHRNRLIAEDPNVDPNHGDTYHFDVDKMPIQHYEVAVP